MQREEQEHSSRVTRKETTAEQVSGEAQAPSSIQPGLREIEILRTIETFSGAETIPQFLALRRELLAWNERINLTTITDPRDVLLKHFLDSLTLLQVYSPERARVLDIGAGAGFPGLPLKLARPAWEVVLLEATGKKVNFQRHVIETLGLRGIEAIHGRAEELACQSSYRASFDLVTARAVASLPVLLEYSAPFCRPGGQILLPKKGELDEEVQQGKRAARILGLVCRGDIPITLPGLNDGRRILVWEQVEACPAQYPRSGSAIAKKPLGYR